MAEPKYKKEQFLKVEKNDNLTFWWLNKKKDKYVFDKLKLANYLESIGVFRYYTTKTDYILIRIIDNIVDYTDIATIKHTIVEYIKTLKNKKLLSALQANIGTMVTDVSLQLVSKKDIDLYQGEKDTIYTFYSDMIAVEKKGEATTMEYKDFHQVIWRSSVFLRKYPDENLLTDNEPGTFERFFNNVFKNPENRKYVRHVFGYALQRYRKLSNMRAIIITDDNIDDQAKGGTGKGIIFQALKQFMQGVKENGKAYRANRQFSFQNLNLDTRICLLDDVPPHFDITQLFSVITDGLFIEKKNQPPFWVDATNAPLFIVNSNHGVSGSDDSHIRRRYDIGLDKHYHAKFTPEDDFKHQLFREWDTRPVEWIKFDLFMLECANMFINNGVKIWDNPNLEKKQFIADTHTDFEEFADAYLINIEISKPDTLDQLRKLTNKPKLTMNKMTIWNKKYAEINSYDYSENRRNKTFTLTKLYK